MEKGTPHCKLLRVKLLLGSGKVKATFSALAGGAALGLDFAAMVAVIQALKPADFHKKYDYLRGPHHLARRRYPKSLRDPAYPGVW